MSQTMFLFVVRVVFGHVNITELYQINSHVFFTRKNINNA
jgi:hypothetical protein